MDPSPAGRSAAARRVVEGVQRPGARRPDRTRRPGQRQRARRRGAPRAGARPGALDQRGSLAAGRPRRGRAARAGHRRRRRRPGAQPVHARRGLLLRGRSLWPPVARCAGREARRAGAGRPVAERALAGAGERGTDVSGPAGARCGASSGTDHVNHLPGNPVPDGKALARGRCRRARRGAREHRGVRDRIRIPGARAPPRRARERARRAGGRDAIEVLAAGRGMEHRAAHHPGGRAQHRAHAPARRLGRAAIDARRAVARRRGQGRVVPQRGAHRLRRLRLHRHRRPAAVVVARLADRRAGFSAAARRRAAQGRRREHQRPARRRGGAVPRTGAGRFQGRRGPARRARLLSEQAEAQARAVASASRTSALSGARYRAGYVSQLELLDAQRSELRNRRQELQVRSDRYQSTVALVRALGGGWQ